MKNELTEEKRERMQYDILIVGAGPAGLAAAIRLRQIALAASRDLSVCVLEKGSEPGAHIISGAIMDATALEYLFPDWASDQSLSWQRVTEEQFAFLTPSKSYALPGMLLPDSLKNRGHKLISLSQLVRWLAEQAELLGVDIFPGYPATGLLYSDRGAICGVVTKSVGIDRSGNKTAAYQPGVEITAAYTFFAEGARGELGQQLITHFSLDQGRDPQSYAISIKEVWEADEASYQPGLVLHTAGWPLDNRTYGGGFLYHMSDKRIAVGLTVGLAYENPYLSPFAEFQRLKSHPAISRFLKGGKRLEYGARVMAAGGLQAMPELVFPGGALLGCEAGFMNGARLKGIHTAIRSGIMAAEAASEALCEGRSLDRLDAYPERFKKSRLYEELYRARNFKPLLSRGLALGGMVFGADQLLLKGRLPWTFHRDKPDHLYLESAAASRPIDYGQPDDALTFDLNTSLYLSGTRHEENQPSHLRLKDPGLPVSLNLPVYAGPEARYCPAAVYSFEKDENGMQQLHIQATNCLHCKTCDIKDPSLNIVWVSPEGGGGSHYHEM